MEKNDFGEILGRNLDFCGAEREERHISTQRGDVYYFAARSQRDNSRWLVLTHGLGMDHTVFYAVAAAFLPYYNILTWDLPLHGMSEVYGDFSFDGCALDLKAVMDAEGIETAFVCGHCIGGCAVQAFADMFPEICLALVLVDTFPFDSALYGADALNWLGKLSGAARALPSRALAAAMAGLLSGSACGERALKCIMEAQNTARVMDTLSYVMCELPKRRAPNYSFPVLDIVGEHDRLGPIRSLNEKAADKRGYILSSIESAGHTPYLDNPGAFNTVLADFLQ